MVLLDQDRLARRTRRTRPAVPPAGARLRAGSADLLRGCRRLRRSRVCDASSYRFAEVVTSDAIRVGEAAFAIDPLSSSGVQTAMQTGLAAAATIRTRAESRRRSAPPRWTTTPTWCEAAAGCSTSRPPAAVRRAPSRTRTGRSGGGAAAARIWSPRPRRGSVWTSCWPGPYAFARRRSYGHSLPGRRPDRAAPGAVCAAARTAGRVPRRPSAGPAHRDDGVSRHPGDRAEWVGTIAAPRPWRTDRLLADRARSARTLRSERPTIVGVRRRPANLCLLQLIGLRHNGAKGSVGEVCRAHSGRRPAVADVWVPPGQAEARGEHMARRRVSALFMRDEDLRAVEGLMSAPTVSGRVVVGEVEDEQIGALRDAGLFIYRVDPESGPELAETRRPSARPPPSVGHPRRTAGDGPGGSPAAGVDRRLPGGDRGIAPAGLVGRAGGGRCRGARAGGRRRVHLPGADRRRSCGAELSFVSGLRLYVAEDTMHEDQFRQPGGRRPRRRLADEADGPESAPAVELDELRRDAARRGRRRRRAGVACRPRRGGGRRWRAQDPHPDRP